MDGWRVIAITDVAKSLLQVYLRQETWTYAVRLYGIEANAKLIATALRHRLDHFMTIWALTGFDETYDFTDEDIGSHVEQPAFLALVPLFAPACIPGRRLAGLRALRPQRVAALA